MAPLAELHRRLHLPPPGIREVVPTSAKTPQTWRYTTDQPSGDWVKAEYDDSTWRVGKGMFGKEGTRATRLGAAR